MACSFFLCVFHVSFLFQDLSVINNMLRRGPQTPKGQKRLLQEDDKSDSPAGKKCRDALSDALTSRLGEVIAQRQANGAR
jgi:hypothetical protein